MNLASTPRRPQPSRTLIGLVALAAIALPLASSASAQYVETLGPATIPVASGSDIISAGTGLYDTGEGSIELDIPAGVTVKQVLLYWGGRALTGVPYDDDLVLSGTPVTGAPVNVTGVLVGEAALPEPLPAFTYRADVTSLLTLAPGTNTVDVSGFDPSIERRDGASLVAIVDDGVGSGTLYLYDGADYAWVGTGDVINQQTFVFPAAAIDRTASLIFLVGDTQADRPERLEIWRDGVSVFNQVNYFQQLAGPQWSDRREEIPFPAGSTSLSAQLFSEGPPGSNPESLTWNVFAAFVPAPPRLGCTYTQGGYKNVRMHADRWPIDYSALFPYGNTGASYLEILLTPVRGDAWMNLAHQYIAANNNYINNGSSAPANVEAALSEAEALLSSYDPGAVPKSAKQAFITAKNTLDSYNNGNEGVPHCDDIARSSDDSVKAPRLMVETPADDVAVYPNPLRSAATVQVSLTEASHVHAVVYDVMGREVAVLAQREFGAGTHSLALDASALAPGMYVYRVETERGQWAGRMSVVR